MSIATKLQTVYDGVEDVRDALQEADINLGRGTIDTLGDDIRSLTAGGTGYGFKVYGDVRSEEEVEVTDPDTQETTTETQYTYTRSLILDSTLAAMGDDLNTDVIDGIGELDGDMVDLGGGKVQIPLNTGVVITVDATKTYVKFRDPIVEQIVLSHWGTDGKITLAVVRTITNFQNYFHNQTGIETFNEFKWFDHYVGANGGTNNNAYPFSGCTSLTEVKIPRTTSIGSGPFNGCTSLAHIDLPDTITSLGTSYSYQKGYIKGTSIEELVIPDSVTKTQEECFIQIASLKRIVWGDNLPFPNDLSINQDFYNCSNLEKIDNLPSTFSGSKVNFGGCSKLVFTNICQPLLDSITNAWLQANTRRFEGTKFFDYVPNGVVTINGFTGGSPTTEYTYLFTSNSEAGFTMRFPNWTTGVSLSYSSKIGRVELGSDVESMHNRFWYSTDITEWILPCNTPPTLASYTAMNDYTRIFVPGSAMSAYLADSIWSQHAAHLLPIEDSTQVQFCSIPDSCSIPDGYTKVTYISNINGDGVKNCQISNMGYKPKRYSQFLFDFSHKATSVSVDIDYSALLITEANYKDFHLTLYNTDTYPAVYRLTSKNANYPNHMGINLHQKWFFNSHITGESFGQRSILKMNYKWIEYHGLRHRVDEASSDSNTNLAFLRYGNNLSISRQIKLYRFCIFEPIENAADYDDPANYEIVRDYVPAMRNSDGVYGLYERLTDTFYSSTISSAPFSGPTYE